MSANRTRDFQFWKRFFLFRFGAVLLGLLPFVLLEMVLYGIGWQHPGGVKDPFVGFTEIRPLFEPDATGTSFEVSESRYPLVRPDQFLINKPDDEFRIFCVGGSTVQGRPLAIETSFSTWLELRLQAADPSKTFNAVNCGGVSYASYRLASIVEEIIEYQPDLIVLYTGHNEFLEDRTYEAIKMAPPWVVRTHERLSSIKTYSFLRSLYVRDANESSNSGGKTSLAPDVEARLDYRGGMDEYHRDDAWTRDVVRHFEHNLRRMVKATQDAGVPLILCNPVSNLRDSSPFKSQNSSGLTTEQLTRFTESWESIQHGETSDVDLNRELEQLETLVAIDPRHAGLQYRLGETYHQLDDIEKAKTHFIRAKEEDICPLRIIEPMNDVIADVANEFDVPLVDVMSFFEQRAEDRIPGRESLLDHVHPSIHGHQLISGLLMDEMIRQNWVEPVGDYELETQQRFESHLQSLSFMYFERGRDRLDGLKRWAQGRVTRERDE